MSDARSAVEASPQCATSPTDRELDRVQRYIKYFYEQVVVLSRNSLWFNGLLAGASGIIALQLTMPNIVYGAVGRVLVFATIPLGAIGMIFNFGSLLTIETLIRLVNISADRGKEVDPRFHGALHDAYSQNSNPFFERMSSMSLTKIFYWSLALLWLPTFPVVLFIIYLWRPPPPARFPAAPRAAGRWVPRRCRGRQSRPRRAPGGRLHPRCGRRSR